VKLYKEFPVSRKILFPQRRKEATLLRSRLCERRFDLHTKQFAFEHSKLRVHKAMIFILSLEG
jgi:hypothetical protein